MGSCSMVALAATSSVRCIHYYVALSAVQTVQSPVCKGLACGASSCKALLHGAMPGKHLNAAQQSDWWHEAGLRSSRPVCRPQSPLSILQVEVKKLRRAQGENPSPKIEAEMKHRQISMDGEQTPP